MDMASKTRFRPDFFSYVRCWYLPGPNQPLLCTTHGLERAQLEKAVVLGRRQRGNAPWVAEFLQTGDAVFERGRKLGFAVRF